VVPAKRARTKYPSDYPNEFKRQKADNRLHSPEEWLLLSTVAKKTILNALAAKKESLGAVLAERAEKSDARKVAKTVAAAAMKEKQELADAALVVAPVAYVGTPQEWGALSIEEKRDEAAKILKSGARPSTSLAKMNKSVVPSSVAGPSPKLKKKSVTDKTIRRSSQRVMLKSLRLSEQTRTCHNAERAIVVTLVIRTVRTSGPNGGRAKKAGKVFTKVRHHIEIGGVGKKMLRETTRLLTEVCNDIINAVDSPRHDVLLVRDSKEYDTFKSKEAATRKPLRKMKRADVVALAMTPSGQQYTTIV